MWRDGGRCWGRRFFRVRPDLWRRPLPARPCPVVVRMPGKEVLRVEELVCWMAVMAGKLWIALHGGHVRAQQDAGSRGRDVWGGQGIARLRVIW